jgi:hypothetical protein
MAELTASGAVYEAKQGNSVVYRHGTCAVSHKSPETAATCRKSSPSPTREMQTESPVSDSPTSDIPLEPGHRAFRSAIAWPVGILIVGLVAGLAILVADPIRSAAKDAASKRHCHVD